MCSNYMYIYVSHINMSCDISCVLPMYILLYIIIYYYILLYILLYIITYYYIYIITYDIICIYRVHIYIYISIIHITYSHIEYTVDCIIFWLSAQRSASRFEVSNAGLEDQQLHLFRRGTWWSWGTWWRGQRPKQSWYLPSGYFV